MAIIKTAIALVLLPFLIQASLWLLEISGNSIKKKLQQPSTTPKNAKRGKIWRSLTFFSLSKLNSLRFGRSLLNEVVIVFWVLLTLFWLAFWQGLDDAKRDAFNPTSTRPVIAFITPEKRLILGRNLEKSLDKNQLAEDSSIEGYKIIGDVELFKKLQQEDANEAKRGRVWRLLIERGDWIYLFATLPVDAEPDEKPAVIAIEKGDPGDRLMILGPVSPETN